MRWQYQAKVSPLLPIAMEWTITTERPPDRIFSAARFITSVWVPQHSDAEGSDLGWTPRYPDQIVRSTVRAADQPLFTSGTTASSLPIPETSWTPKYPNFLWRTTLPTAAVPTLFQEPFPRPPAALLTAWAFYPDRIDRFAPHPSRLPFFVPGPLVPIPNPVVAGVLDDKIHLGTKESLGVTSQPTVGGWQAW